jgi:hypothetical protein
MTELKIRSAISWWLWIPIYTLIIGQGIFMAQETHIATLLFHFGLAILIYFLVVRIQYILTDRELIIKVGPFQYSKISLKSIRKMELSNNPLSAPAASLKRLAIHYDKWGYVLISPPDREFFMSEIERRRALINEV